MAVVTDSTSSLDPVQATRAKVAVIPLQVVIDDRSRPESEVPAGEVAAALRSGRRVSTSRPAPELIGALYADLAEAGYDAVVSVHLSAKISGTCAAAERAASTGMAMPAATANSQTKTNVAGPARQTRRV